MKAHRWLPCLVIMAMLAPAAAAAGWPKIPKHEQQLTELPDHPNAPAVILLREGDVHISLDRRSSYVEVYARIKILTEEGTHYGTVSMESGRYRRTKNIEGRTHLPDGRVAEMPKDATFEKEFSDYYDVSVLSCAMPEVVPGAIVEFRYRTFFDSYYYPQLWYFQAEIPTLVSRVNYHLPELIKFYPVELNTLPWIELEKDIDKGVRKVRASYTMRNVPPVPDEPFRFPFADLAARVMVLPKADISRSQTVYLLDSWEHLIQAVVGEGSYGYSRFRRDSRAAKSQAKTVAAPHSTPRARAAAVYRWVRDEIDLEPFVGIFIGEDHTADKVLKNRTGDRADLALLLEVMLDAVGVNATVAWANPRRRGRVFPNVPNPLQFRSVLVVAKFGDERVFLDPSDSSCAYGALPPDLQAVPCLIVRSPDSYEWVDTPRLGADESRRVVSVDLQIDETGAVAGTGTAELSGCHAWLRLQWKDTEDDTVDAWKEWIEDGYSGFDVRDVDVEEDAETMKIEVHWAMSQREEEVLGDEVEVSSAGPLAIAANPFTLEANQRVTPVQLSFPDTDVYRLTVGWPADWRVDGEPVTNEFINDAGRLTSSFAFDPEQRTATIERTVVISQNEFVGAEAYASLQELYRVTVANDAKTFVLIAE